MSANFGQVTYVDLPELEEDPDPPVDAGRLYAKEVAGKTAYFVIFPTGDPILISAEP